MSRLLINESPLQVLPSLAKAIGLNEAIFLQQLHYWISHKNAPKREGRNWHYGNYEHWLEQFPFWSIGTLKRILKSLVTKNLIIKKQFQAESWNHTNWYSIDYDELAKFEIKDKEEPPVENQHVDNPMDNPCTDQSKMIQSRMDQDGYVDQSKMIQSYKEKENNKRDYLNKNNISKGEHSVDNSEQLPTSASPPNNKILKNNSEQLKNITKVKQLITEATMAMRISNG